MSFTPACSESRNKARAVELREQPFHTRVFHRLYGRHFPHFNIYYIGIHLLLVIGVIFFYLNNDEVRVYLTNHRQGRINEIR